MNNQILFCFWNVYLDCNTFCLANLSFFSASSSFFSVFQFLTRFTCINRAINSSFSFNLRFKFTTRFFFFFFFFSTYALLYICMQYTICLSTLKERKINFFNEVHTYFPLHIYEMLENACLFFISNELSFLFMEFSEY